MAKMGFLEKSAIPGIKKIIFENGITVFLEELPERKKVVFLVGIGVGSRDEIKEISGASNLLARQGISHFLEHAHFISNAFRTADEITEDIEDGGADFNAGTCFNYTIFHIKGYPRYLSKNIRILYEIIGNHEYNEDELEKERQEVLTEIKDYIDSPKDYCHDSLFYPSLFRKTSFEKPVIGTLKSVKHITKEDLIAFKKRFYIPANMVVFVCGKFEEQKVMNMIYRTFGRLRPHAFEPPGCQIDLKNRYCEPSPKKRKGLKLAYLIFGYKAPGLDHADSIKLMLLDSVLSGGMSCRLSRRLKRERGIGYNVESDYINLGNAGAFSIMVGGFDSRRFREAKKLILEELEDLKANLVSKREFLRAKNIFLSASDDKIEDIRERAELLADVYFEKSVFDPRNLKKYISKISREAIRRTAQKYFTEGYTLTALVPENFKK